MSGVISLPNAINAVLKQQPERHFTVKAIAEQIFQDYPEYCAKKRQSSKQDLSDDAALIQQIRAEIGSILNAKNFSKKNPKIKSLSDRPRKFYWTKKSDEQEITEAEKQQSFAAPEHAQAESSDTVQNQAAAAKILPPAKKIREYDLYPLLAKFLFSECNVYSKRIDEKRSANKRGKNSNKWLHPDIVGLEDLSREWGSEIKECAQKSFA